MLAGGRLSASEKVCAAKKKTAAEYKAEAKAAEAAKAAAEAAEAQATLSGRVRHVVETTSRSAQAALESLVKLIPGVADDEEETCNPNLRDPPTFFPSKGVQANQ